ncbi:kelch repeat-containing protein [Shewanella sp. UCD-KL21]|uniref:Kelch repeat-containing protein n=1 Tax=Shewanella sp. UCD-KL21 TaxID=1917164 RepID=UPI0020C99504|nr:kelch repeat-containing protein [Shewanella sp. UCD-KL21]
MLSGCSTKAFFQAEPVTLSSARFGHAAVNDGQNIYVLAGDDGTGFLSEIEIIEPLSGKKQVLANKLIPRRYFSAVWDGKDSIYIIGGISIENQKSRYEHRVEVFNTVTHQVSFAEPLPAPTRRNSAVLYNGNIYVFGGSYPKNGQLTPTGLVAVLNVETQRWVRATNMPTAKETRAVVHNGYIYVVGGYDNKTSLTTFEKYDPQLKHWQTLPDLPEAMSAHSMSVVNQKMFVFGSYDNLTLTYAYDFVSEQWQKIDIGYQASRHNAATTLGNTTYVIGGTTGKNGPFLNDIQAFKL